MSANGSVTGSTPSSPLPADLSALSVWAPELAQAFVSLASDIALVVGADGVIRSVVQCGGEPIADSGQRWVGQAWVDTVSGETRPKVEHLLREVVTAGIARRREVNHLLNGDAQMPVAYTAVQLGTHGPVLAVGRDLRSIAAIQQRYVQSQQETERVYWQARQAEARHPLLSGVPTDAGSTPALRIEPLVSERAGVIGDGIELLNGAAAAAKPMTDATDGVVASAIAPLLQELETSTRRAAELCRCIRLVASDAAGGKGSGSAAI